MKDDPEDCGSYNSESWMSDDEASQSSQTTKSKVFFLVSRFYYKFVNTCALLCMSHQNVVEEMKSKVSQETFLASARFESTEKSIMLSDAPRSLSIVE